MVDGGPSSRVNPISWIPPSSILFANAEIDRQAPERAYTALSEQGQEKTSNETKDDVVTENISKVERQQPSQECLSLNG